MPGAEHDDRAGAALRAVALLVREVVVGRPRLELARAGVDREPARRAAARAYLLLADAEQARDPLIGQSEPLRRRHVAACDELALGGTDRLELGSEVGMQARDLGQVVARLDPLESLQERLRERPAEPQRLPDRTHLGAEHGRVAWELVEVEARRLDRDVVERRLERGARRPGDVVRELVQRVADGEQGRELGDREAGRLRRERGGAGDARVHLDQRELARRRLVGELDVRAAGGDAHGARARERRVTQPLQLAVVQRLLRRDRPRVAGVHADRVEVLDRADDDAVAGRVDDDLELELLPPLERALDEHLADRARGEAVRDAAAQLGARPRDPAAASPEREGGADDGRDRALVELLERGDDDACRHGKPGSLHRRAEARAVLRGSDRIDVGADQLDSVLGEHAELRQLDGEVERGLAAERRQQRVGSLARHDLGERRRVERLEIGRVRPLRVGHDRRRVRVGQDDAVALGPECPARLHARVVELAPLADPDRPGADDQDVA